MDEVPEISPLGSPQQPLGVLSTRVQIPPVREMTKFVNAGAVYFGVEERTLNEDVVLKQFLPEGPDAEAVQKIKADYLIFDDVGLSMHVFGTASEREYLRFDMFPKSPHYHYIHYDPDYHITVTYDVAACGNMLHWTLTALRLRIGSMLVSAGAPELVIELDQAEIERAIKRVSRVCASLEAPIAGS